MRSLWMLFSAWTCLLPATESATLAASISIRELASVRVESWWKIFVCSNLSRMHQISHSGSSPWVIAPLPIGMDSRYGGT